MTGHNAISLSTVREPCEEMGREAAKTMIELTKHPGKAPIQRLIPGDELMVRRTTQRPVDGVDSQMRRRAV